MKNKVWNQIWDHVSKHSTVYNIDTIRTQTLIQVEDKVDNQVWSQILDQIQLGPVDKH